VRILRRRKEWGEFAGILRERNSLCEFEVFAVCFLWAALVEKNVQAGRASIVEAEGE
jgi:hypothetical protein